jgi:predicted NBD/HSP70 family sugar kinase
MQRAHEGDERTLRGLTEVGRHLGVGIANLINAVDPQVVVGGGYIGRLGEWLIPLIVKEVEARAIDGDALRCRIVGSALGADAAAIGAAIAALQPGLADPTLVPAP